MHLNEMIIKRFKDLEIQANAIPVSTSGGYRFYRTEQWQQWATSAQHLIGAVFGQSSSHHQNFSKEYSKCVGHDEDVKALKGIFRAAKDDYESGFAFSLQASISGEIYGDFVALAKNALTEGGKDVAAVLACAALEDALKRYAMMNGLDVSDRAMQDVVSALKSKGLVGGAQKTLLDTMPKIRDFAMHANWSKISPQDVGSVIGFVEQLLLTKFS